MSHRISPHLLFWLSLMLAYSSTTANQGSELNQRREQAYKVLDDNHGTGDWLYEIRTRSKIHCSLMCLECAGCRGCNYESASKRCTFIQSGNSQPRNGLAYMYKLLNPYTRDCEDIWESGITANGVYAITVNQTGTRHKVKVFCEFSNGNIWTILLKRTNDSLLFGDRNWAEYRAGFGEPHGSFYLGNENLHDLTTNNGLNFALRIELTDNFGLSLYADYEYFAVQDEGSKYLLTLGLPMNTSTLGDSFGKCNGMMFSTIDNDNDPLTSANCAQINSGGWWYWGCSFCKLMAGYGPNYSSLRRISWRTWPRSNVYFGYAAMMLRRNVSG